MNKPNWSLYKHIQMIQPWQAIALALDINPISMKRSHSNYLADFHFDFLPNCFPSEDIQHKYSELALIFKSNQYNRSFFSHENRNEVSLGEFATWCIFLGLEIPPGLAALANDAPQVAPSPKVEATPADDPDETLAALFDPLPVEALEKMFPTVDRKWKSWAERAKANGLDAARESRGMFNPYKAGLWFVRRGAKDWDEARLNRTLANNLPARSRDEKHLLTSEIDQPP